MSERFFHNLDTPREPNYENMSPPRLKAEYQRIIGVPPTNLTGNEEIDRQILIRALRNADEEKDRIKKKNDEENLTRRRLKDLEEDQEERRNMYRPKR